MTSMHVACDHITYRYPGAEMDLFTDLSIRLEEPGFHALFGPSGVGKTSLARIITGDIADYTGTVSIGAHTTPLYSHNLERLPGWSGVGNHIDKVTPPHNRDKRDKLISAFGMAAFMGARFSQLSLGQKNRVNLLRYLLQDFQLLIMDESLANVDERTREGILLTIKTLFPDTFFLYISHNVVEVSTFCRDILVFRTSGRTSFSATIRGQDARRGIPVDRDALQKTMLEVMNAA